VGISGNGGGLVMANEARERVVPAILPGSGSPLFIGVKAD
jgi:hypothetical protein